MKIKILCLIFCEISSIILSAQNLIQDGGFEEIVCPDNPINSISDVDPWYAIGADAYLLHVECPFDPIASASVVALKRDISPYRGFAYISLESLLSASGYFITEGMGTELKEPLKKGYYYYFDMAYMNYEDELSQNFEDSQCDQSPPRSMNVLFAEGRIEHSVQNRQVEEGFIITDVTTNGIIKLTENAPKEANFRANKWKFYWDCFEAEGGEKHMAVTGTNGLSNVNLNCFDNDSPQQLFFSGHAIDELRLHSIPMRIDTVFLICQGGMEINLVDIVNEPFADKALFTWEDGSNSTQRGIKSAGTYNIDMVLPCVTVPITLDIEEISCRAEIYLGNIFSPNADGLNDVFAPIISSVLSISFYSFNIYNRWGERVYHTNEISEGWNGQIGQSPPYPDVYIWMIEYKLEDGSEEMLFEKGDVTLIK